MNSVGVITADAVISGAGVNNTFNYLISEKDKGHFNLDEIRSTRPSVSHFSLYIGLKHTAEELDLPTTNFWIYPDHDDHDESMQKYMADRNQDFPVVYISFPGAKDPDFTKRYPGKTTIEIVTISKYDWFKEWEDTKWKKRGASHFAVNAGPAVMVSSF